MMNIRQEGIKSQNIVNNLSPIKKRKEWLQFIDVLLTRKEGEVDLFVCFFYFYFAV